MGGMFQAPHGPGDWWFFSMIPGNTGWFIYDWWMIHGWLMMNWWMDYKWMINGRFFLKMINEKTEWAVNSRKSWLMESLLKAAWPVSVGSISQSLHWFWGLPSGSQTWQLLNDIVYLLKQYSFRAFRAFHYYLPECSIPFWSCNPSQQCYNHCGTTAQE